ncbi:cobalt-precorrin-5B (C(1))-methyltransferase [Ureibacillus sp. FSL K6-2830]|uniref:cobalt-precorrin-5B (C(1))-methyltransferase n=1 Tax=Ureibacillus sp. FSL K6-2830 TaxID=2954610 RepID=UPI0030F5B8BA
MQKQKRKDPSELREGYTTGACATACAKAALISLITKLEQKKVMIHLPVGKDVEFSIEKCEIRDIEVKCSVIKDGGDDPDATHGAIIEATVSWRKDKEIFIDGGKGVGRVTKPGLPIEVGLAAINPVPRKMIQTEVEKVLQQYGIETGVNIIITVPEGEEIAKKTLNSRLGIIGGISILGTRGTVVPFSNAAYMASIVQAISVAKAAGSEHLVFTTGGRSEKFAMSMYSELPEVAFIEMGDFVGFSMKQCKQLGIPKVSLVGMMGKFSKLAQGSMMLHSKGSQVNFEFLASIARESGATNESVRQILQANTANEVGEIMKEQGCMKFFDKLSELCCKEILKHVGGGLIVSTAIYSMKGELLGKAEIIDAH